MTTEYPPCPQCGEPIYFKGNTVCVDCGIIARRERSYVPMFGDGKRLSGATGQCSRCGRRGCMCDRREVER